MGLVQTKRKKSLAALVAAMMAGLLALPLMLASPAAAQTARSTAPACANVPEKAFTDEAQHGGANSELENAIECIAAYGITTGKADGSYAPNERNSREQMATFINRKLKLVTGLTVPAGGNKFAREGISAVHRPNVESAAATNPPITVGYSDGTFKALRGVARDEMATFIVRQLRAAGATVPAASGAQFPDVDPASPHADNIRILRQMGIVQGRADGTYGPKDIVTRGNMSIFLSRDIAELVAQGKVPAFGGGSGGNLTTRPELVSARVVSTVATGVLAGTTVEYLFDEAVQNVDATRFWVITGANGRTAGGTVVSQSNANAVHIRFTGITTSAGAQGLTLATVDRTAVRDTTGSANPEGDAALGASGGQALPAGVTQAPDLTAVQNFRAGTSTLTFVDFVFDENATTTGGGAYRLVPISNQTADINCVLDSGSGTTTHVVRCLNTDFAAAGTTIPATGIARGYVLAGTVTSATAVANPLQAANVTGGSTGGPDLESVTILQNQTNPTFGTQVDVALFTFDEPVATPAAGSLQAYFTNGTELSPTLGTQGPTAQSPRSVLAVYNAGELNNAVGGSVDANGVSSTTGATPGTANRPDEEGAANTSPTATSGRTNAPDLVSVVRRPGTDIFGAATGGSVFRYTFDEAIVTGGATPVNSTLFSVFLADGTSFDFAAGQCARVATPGVPGSGGSAPGNTQVDCTFPPGGSTPSNTQMTSAVLGTVDNGAVQAQDAGGAAGQNNEAGRGITNAS